MTVTSKATSTDPRKWPPRKWLKVRAEYEGGKPIATIAKDYKVSRRTIHTKINVEGWRVDRDPVPEITETEIPALRAPDPNDPPIVSEGRALILRMLEELDVVTSKRGEFVAMIEEATAGDRDPRRRDAMLRAIDLPSRSTTLKNLATAAKTFSEVHGGAALGKKELAVEAAKSAGIGTDWGDDLSPLVTSLN